MYLIREMRNAYKILVEKSKREIPGGRHGRRWEDNIRTDLREMGREIVEWMRLVQDKTSGGLL
jgi:hypothetical protein